MLVPLHRFPGNWAAYTALLEVVDAELLAKAQAWIATTPHAQDDSYNVSNGDVFRWWVARLLPRLDDLRGMTAAALRTSDWKGQNRC